MQEILKRTNWPKKTIILMHYVKVGRLRPYMYEYVLQYIYVMLLINTIIVIIT